MLSAFTFVGFGSTVVLPSVSSCVFICMLVPVSLLNGAGGGDPVIVELWAC